ncbi:hypothetical protein OIU79_028532 [Salix purpurea]|uniref:Leucine-rich repeat-containing N-terminal plant-type domain-containing protein n=1 Tax=Salix purpurea TaxID=77065 RepID=A0A9Q1A302_SALPP|nr:hypothetical protein OIU79_028532 [Salix purpurea]
MQDLRWAIQAPVFDAEMKLLFYFSRVAVWFYSVTDSNDFAILKAFREGLENPGLLEWPTDGDDPCGQSWKHVFCSGSRVTQIQVQNMSLKGTLPQNLQRAYKTPKFDSIPSNCFDGLVSLQFLALDSNNFNASKGWSFPEGLQDSAQLTSLSSSKEACPLQNLWLNDQNGGGLSGTIDVVTTMESVNVLWLHGNQFTGTIPESIGNLTAFAGSQSEQQSTCWLRS